MPRRKLRNTGLSLSHLSQATPPDFENKSRDRLTPPPGEDFWVFGYGSLMWNPGFPHLEVQPALLRGYHRAFRVYSHRYRGTPARPGLVLGLDRGGSCRGLAYRVRAAEGEEVMDYLHAREMITGIYVPTWLKVESPRGTLSAASFVVDRAHRRYSGKLTLEETAAYIRQGHGERGSGHEYLSNTVRRLEALGLGTGGLKRLLRLVEG